MTNVEVDSAETRTGPWVMYTDPTSTWLEDAQVIESICTSETVSVDCPPKCTSLQANLRQELRPCNRSKNRCPRSKFRFHRTRWDRPRGRPMWRNRYKVHRYHQPQRPRRTCRYRRVQCKRWRPESESAEGQPGAPREYQIRTPPKVISVHSCAVTNGLSESKRAK